MSAETTDTTAPCPHCGGRGGTVALLNVGGRCRETALPCRTCEGTGVLTGHELPHLLPHTDTARKGLARGDDGHG